MEKETLIREYTGVRTVREYFKRSAKLISKYGLNEEIKKFILENVDLFKTNEYIPYLDIYNQFRELGIRDEDIIEYYPFTDALVYAKALINSGKGKKIAELEAKFIPTLLSDTNVLDKIFTLDIIPVRIVFPHKLERIYHKLKNPKEKIAVYLLLCEQDADIMEGYRELILKDIKEIRAQLTDFEKKTVVKSIEEYLTRNIDNFFSFPKEIVEDNLSIIHGLISDRNLPTELIKKISNHLEEIPFKDFREIVSNFNLFTDSDLSAMISYLKDEEKRKYIYQVLLERATKDKTLKQKSRKIVL